MRDYFPHEDEDENDFSDLYHDLEADAIDCGYDPDFKGICWHVGSEHCSFWCPLHDLAFSEEG